MMDMADKAEHFYNLAQNLLDDLGSMGVTDMKSMKRAHDSMDQAQRDNSDITFAADDTATYTDPSTGQTFEINDDNMKVLTANEHSDDLVGVPTDSSGEKMTKQQFDACKKEITGMNQTSMGEMQKSMILFTWYMAQGEIEKGAAKNLTTQMSKIGQGLSQG